MTDERLIPEHLIEGEDSGETQELHKMLDRAKSYISGFDWCPPIADVHMGVGVGEVVAVFLIRFEDKIDGSDDRLWVIEGDVPSAYLVADNAHDATTALEAYCDLMEEWVEAVSQGESVAELFPVGVPAEQEYADMLRSRIRFIREEIIPQLKE